MAAALAVFATFGKPYGAYANGFTEITKDFLKDKPTVDALSAREDVTPTSYADTVLSWVDQGATIVAPDPADYHEFLTFFSECTSRCQEKGVERLATCRAQADGLREGHA